MNRKICKKVNRRARKLNKQLMQDVFGDRFWVKEVQKSYNLQFTNKNPSKVKKAIVKGFLKNGNSSVNNENILSVSQEMKSRIEKQVRKAQREQLHYKFNRLQQEKDIKYKNLLG